MENNNENKKEKQNIIFYSFSNDEENNLIQNNNKYKLVEYNEVFNILNEILILENIPFISNKKENFINQNNDNSFSLTFNKNNIIENNNDNNKNNNNYISNIFNSIKESITNYYKFYPFYFKKNNKNNNNDLYIFDIKFYSTSLSYEYFKKLINILLFFDNTKNNNNDNNLIRIFQMIFGNLFLNIEIYDYLKENIKLELESNRNEEFLYIDEQNLNNLKYNIIILFFDNPIHLIKGMKIKELNFFFDKIFSKTLKNLSNILNHENDNFIINKMYSPLSFNIINKVYCFLNSFYINSNQKNKNNNNNDNNNDYREINNIILTFKEIFYFFQINNNNIKIFNFDNTFYENVIINEIFVKIDKNNKINDEKFNKENIYTFNNECYYYDNKNINSIIFLKINYIYDLGITKYKFNRLIFSYFLIKRNKGFISKLINNNNYYYFIGILNNKLIGIKTNLNNNNNINEENDILNKNNFQSFEIKEDKLFLIDINELESFIVFIFEFHNLYEYIDLINNIKLHCNQNNKLFNYKEIEDIENNENKEENIIFKKEIIDYINNNNESKIIKDNNINNNDLNLSESNIFNETINNIIEDQPKNFQLNISKISFNNNNNNNNNNFFESIDNI